MEVAFYCLLYIYGLSMGISTVMMKDILSPQQVLFNLVACCLLFFASVHKGYFLTGILLLLTAAIFNGIVLNGKINPLHLCIRVAISFLFNLFLL